MFQEFFCFNSDGYDLQPRKKKNQYLKKLEYFLKDQSKKDLQNRKCSRSPKIGLITHSILSWGSFCTHYCFNAAWHGGDQPVALLRHYWSPGCFDSGLQLVCIVWSDVTYLSLDNTHRFSMGFRSGEMAGQSSTVISWSANQLEVVLPLWAGAKSCCKMKSASPKSLSAEGSIKCSKISW